MSDNYKFCEGCDEYKLKDEFYKSHQTGCYFRKCKKCHNKNNKEAARLYWIERKKNHGGSQKILMKPDEYTDEWQKEQVFWLMELLNWKYTDGVWWKEGVKDKNKNWYIFKSKPKENKINKNYDMSWLREGQRISKARIMMMENIDDILKMRKEGKLLREIAKKYFVSDTTIRKFIEQVTNENETN